MIEEKLRNLKKMMSGLDQDKLQNSQKIDSISLISQNLTRTRAKIDYGKSQKSKQQSMLSNTQNLNIRFDYSRIPKLARKTMSLNQVSSRFPRKILQDINALNKKKIQNLAKNLYKARLKDMGLKQTQSGWLEFHKTFQLKNSYKGEFRSDKIDLSGLELGKQGMLAIKQILKQYKIIDLSRNIIKFKDIQNIRYSKKLKQLILKNCAMKNEQLCLLFEALVQTPIKVLKLNSPDINNRNNLTKYAQLYNFIQTSKTLQTLQLANIQINPDNEIFDRAKRSSTLKNLNLSKNTGVIGIYKNISELNLSWNSIAQSIALRCNQCSVLKIDLTGNPIPCHLFQQFFITNNFPVVESVILNKIPLDTDAGWLQTFIQRSKSLQNLSLMECQLTRTTFLNIVFGLQQNKSLKCLNMSGNKFPIHGVAENFATSLKKCSVSHLYLQLCDIKDESGSMLFKALQGNTMIQHIDVSKNNLSSKTSQIICKYLKTGCYSLLCLITTQNFIKYDQLKQINGYIDRNVYLSKSKILEQHRKYKNMNTNSNQVLKKIEQTEHTIEQLRTITFQLQDEFMQKQKQNEGLDRQILEEKIKAIIAEQQLYKNKMQCLQKQIHKNHNPETQQIYQS